MGESDSRRQSRRKLLTVAISVGFLVSTLPLSSQAAVSQSSFEACLLERINHSRAEVGVAPLDMATDMTTGVRWWSEWMSSNSFRHMTASERDPMLPEGTFTWAENIAWHSWPELPDCTAIHNAFMNSAGHRANRMNPSMKFAALGAYVDSSGWWVTELFFDANNYPAGPGPASCPPGKDCDTVAFQNGSGKFQIWDQVSTPNKGAQYYFGFPGDIAFSGDWDCDGVETLGLYRQADGYVYLRNSNTQGVADISFFFGIPGDFPVAGDFNGDGCDTVSIYRPSEARFYVINELGQNDGGLGAADYAFYFGVRGDKPFVGDFDGDGVDTVGLHRESSGLVYFRNSNSSGVADFQFVYGIPNDMLVAGDWDGDGKDTVGVYRPSTGMFYIRNSNTAGFADGQVYAGTYTGIAAINP